MPRIITHKLNRFLWVAFDLNDYQKITEWALGFNEDLARERLLGKYFDE